jgi:regulator of nonsense transcripts 1
VITPYEGQRAHITNTLLRQGPLRQDLYRAIEVSSVDAFQVGRGGCTRGQNGIQR